jgi:hypothetical protein
MRTSITIAAGYVEARALGGPAAIAEAVDAEVCRGTCRHCQCRRANRPRGLCWSCYYRPGLRDLFPSTSKYCRRGVADFYGRIVLPAVPTAALPGTPEKVCILEDRARLGVSLWHPLDATVAVDVDAAAGDLGTVPAGEKTP